MTEKEEIQMRENNVQVSGKELEEVAVSILTEYKEAFGELAK